MRYGKEHKEETHKKVVEAASRRFRKDGIEATGVVDLMADVGLTHGGFYAHFSSKENAGQGSDCRGLAEEPRRICSARSRRRAPRAAIRWSRSCGPT